MSTIFFGSSQYCLPILDSLKQNSDLKLVITRPDRPVGRKQILTPSPTKLWAEKNGIPVETDLSALRYLSNLDLGLVADFGQIIPEEIFSRPRLGTFNIHFSKLPDLRGASPIQSALLRGDTTAWITIFRLEKTLDTGPILWQKSYPIGPDETTEDLYVRLFQEVAKELPKIVKSYELRVKRGEKDTLVPQDQSKATYCKKLSRDDGFIKWKELQEATSIQQPVSNYSIYNRYRAIYPWPGLWTYVPTLNNEQGPTMNRRMKILKCHLEGEKLILDQIQFEGEKPQPFSAKLFP